MKFSVETVEEKDKALIISRVQYPFLAILKSELIQRGCEVFFSSQMPVSSQRAQFQYYFFINQEPKHPMTAKHIVSIYINRLKEADKLRRSKIQNLKIISVSGNTINKEHVDRILWFSFSSSHERYLSFTVPTIKTQNKPHFSKLKIQFILSFTPKRFVFFLIFLIIIFHLLFFPFLFCSFFFTYSSYKSLVKEDLSSAKQEIQTGKNLFSITKNLYSIVKPTYALFSISLLPDQLIDINDKALSVFTDGINTIETTQNIAKDFLNKNKSEEEISYMILRIDNLKNRLSTIEDNLSVLQSKIPFQLLNNSSLKLKVADVLDGIAKIRKILKYSDIVFAKNTEKKYLLLFANNMELRPGGGFIGSFGIITIKNFTLADLKIYDVYDADGQLTAHIEPPLPIKKYLGMPHLFLRDSNFSPDFSENYSQAKFFLEKELNMTDLAGSVVITTSAIESFLDAYGDIYLPDFNETINKKNFYLKTQIHVESNFFPGSTQKKTYLSSLIKQLLLNLDNASVKQLTLALKKSLDEKQIAIMVENPNIQQIIDSLYWSGRAIEPVCTSPVENCMVDYLFPFDMNVGPNKVNYFIKRSISQKTKIDINGSIKNVFSIQFHNESSLAEFPGGKYRNYFQIYLPPNTIIKQITNNGTLVEEYETKNERFMSLGFYIEIEPQHQADIKISYDLPALLKKGKGIYQLIVQKQIGSPNSDFAFELQLPNNIYIQNQNFSPLVKGNEIIYNTTLSADKIFFIQLTKD